MCGNFFEFKGKIFSHIINPKTGSPVEHNVVSVSVIGKDCISADSYATALMVLGAEEGMKIINEDNVNNFVYSTTKNEQRIDPRLELLKKLKK